MDGQTAELQTQFDTQGYAVLGDTGLHAATRQLRELFLNAFKTRFTDDPATNRTLIKRFGDDIAVAQLFTAAPLVLAARTIGLRHPVFCGPVVTHYTSNDLTGRSFGLPFHQDWPSMGSAERSAIFWLGLTDGNAATHSLEVVPGSHRSGLAPGTQEPGGYLLAQQEYDHSVILDVTAGDLVIMSPFLIHRTHVNPGFGSWKLSLSRRMDDLTCPSWPARGFANAYGTVVDRDLYRRSR